MVPTPSPSLSSPAGIPHPAYLPHMNPPRGRGAKGYCTYQPPQTVGRIESSPFLAGVRARDLTGEQGRCLGCRSGLGVWHRRLSPGAGRQGTGRPSGRRAGRSRAETPEQRPDGCVRRQRESRGARACHPCVRGATGRQIDPAATESLPSRTPRGDYLVTRPLEGPREFSPFQPVFFFSTIFHAYGCIAEEFWERTLGNAHFFGVLGAGHIRNIRPSSLRCQSARASAHTYEVRGCIINNLVVARPFRTGRAMYLGHIWNTKSEIRGMRESSTGAVDFQPESTE